MGNKQTSSSRRFTSEKTANSYAKSVGGEVKDLRGHENRKSDFKVVFNPQNANRSSSFSNGADFDSDLNMNGTSWHTADDL